jgi:hypothetical protein
VLSCGYLFENDQILPSKCTSFYRFVKKMVTSCTQCMGSSSIRENACPLTTRTTAAVKQYNGEDLKLSHLSHCTCFFYADSKHTGIAVARTSQDGVLYPFWDKSCLYCSSVTMMRGFPHGNIHIYHIITHSSKLVTVMSNFGSDTGWFGVLSCGYRLLLLLFCM